MKQRIVVAAEIPSGARSDEVRIEIRIIPTDQGAGQVKSQTGLTLQCGLARQFPHVTGIQNYLRRGLCHCKGGSTNAKGQSAIPVSHHYL